MSEAWYVCRIKSGYPWYDTASGLERQGFGTFMAIEENISYVSGKKIIVHSPLFGPVYLFVQIDLEVQRWRQINSSTGVQSSGGRALLPTYAEIPQSVPTAMIEALQSRKNSTKAKIAAVMQFSQHEVVKILSERLLGATGVVLTSGKQFSRIQLGQMVAKIANSQLAAA